ncbi:transketolase [Aminobacter aganoensis]|uniref:Transketolase n=2 Tax=Aminobacter aganoensis TaxID=83264 RepID=A0A7X0F625_9HYPH|nr:transketolase [Aminobacter aganoensis]
MTIARGMSYLGQACSAAEILSAIHVQSMDRGRGDGFVLSPSHYALPLWAMLVALGELSEDEFNTFQQDGSPLDLIPSGEVPGTIFSIGSLGQGLSQAVGLALARRLRGEQGKIFVLVSDGELQEGQTWEALMTCGHYQLVNLVILFDLNDSQVDGSVDRVMRIDPVVEKLQAFGLDAAEIDGHDLHAIANAIEAGDGKRTRAIACRTCIWKGIPSLSHREKLHMVSFTKDEAELARNDLAKGASA